MLGDTTLSAVAASVAPLVRPLGTETGDVRRDATPPARTSSPTTASSSFSTASAPAAVTAGADGIGGASSPYPAAGLLEGDTEGSAACTGG